MRLRLILFTIFVASAAAPVLPCSSFAIGVGERSLAMRIGVTLERSFGTAAMARRVGEGAYRIVGQQLPGERATHHDPPVTGRASRDHMDVALGDPRVAEQGYCAGCKVGSEIARNERLHRAFLSHLSRMPSSA